jgi:hypothetical protein
LNASCYTFTAIGKIAEASSSIIDATIERNEAYFLRVRVGLGKIASSKDNHRLIDWRLNPMFFAVRSHPSSLSNVVRRSRRTMFRVLAS